MPQSLGITALVAGGDPSRLLFASRSNAEQYRPALLDNAGGAYPAGTIVFAANADPATVWVKAANGGLPAATDIIGVVTEAIDTTGEAADVKHFVGVGNLELIEQALWNATGGSLNAGDKTALREAMLRQGINLRNAAYQDVTP